MNKIKSTSLRVICLVCSIVGVVCANLCIYAVDFGQSIWVGYLLGVISVLSFVMAYLAYQELGQRPTNELLLIGTLELDTF